MTIFIKKIKEKQIVRQNDRKRYKEKLHLNANIYLVDM